jgi:hypothetical protein
MMISVFNRIVVVLGALAVLAGAIVTVGVAAHVWPPYILLGWFQPQLQLASEATTASRVAIVCLSAVAAVGMLALLLAELIPLRTSVVHVLSTTDKGVATIENQSLCLLAERTGETVHGVNDVDSFIRDSDDGLLIKCRAIVALGANLLEINPELKSRVRDTIQQLTGLRVARVDIKFKYNSDKRSRRVSVR